MSESDRSEDSKLDEGSAFGTEGTQDIGGSGADARSLAADGFAKTGGSISGGPGAVSPNSGRPSSATTRMHWLLVLGLIVVSIIVSLAMLYALGVGLLFMTCGLSR